MEMFGPIDHVALLLVAAFLAGALNAVAGGGSFLTCPAPQPSPRERLAQ